MVIYHKANLKMVVIGSDLWIHTGVKFHLYSAPTMKKCKKLHKTQQSINFQKMYRGNAGKLRTKSIVNPVSEASIFMCSHSGAQMGAVFKGRTKK